MTKIYAPHLAVIRESMTAIDGYLPKQQDTFLANPMLQDAVLMRLQVIGEHLARMRHIDEERFAGVADDGWYQLIGLRTIISHGYETIEPERIWQMVRTELPALRAGLVPLSHHE